MKVGIEQLRTLEEMANKQIRIYPDACDEGIVVADGTGRLPILSAKSIDFDNRDIPMVQLLKETIQELKDIGFVYEEESWSGGKSIKFNFAFEHDEINRNMLLGTSAIISWNVDKSRKIAFFSIYFKRFRGSKNQWLKGE